MSSPATQRPSRPTSVAGSSDRRPSVLSKHSLKRVEIPLNKFNEVAVPHHVDLLKRHKNNIEKFQLQGAWDQVHREQVNATRLVKQLKALLYEMDILRNQVQDSDRAKFDQITAAARQSAQDAITEYLDLIPRILTPSSSKHNRPMSGNLLNLVIHDEKENEDKRDNMFSNRNKSEKANLEIQMKIRSEELDKQRQCLESWEHLQGEVRDINELFNDFSKIVQQQQEDVDHIESSVETAAENVEKGVSHLRRAKVAIYPLAGAVIGGCIGGPIGLAIGMKMGGLAALGGGLLGFTGGKILKKKREGQINECEVELLNIQKNRSAKGSASLPEITNPEMSLETSAYKSRADIL